MLLSPPIGPFKADVRVSADQPDPNPDDNTASASATVLVVPDAIPVEVRDAPIGFSPAAQGIGLGGTVQWNFLGPGQHSAYDPSGIGLFASGIKTPPAYAAYRFVGAGTFAVRDARNAAALGSIVVPMNVAPGSGLSFNIVWGAAAPPSGVVFDVQVRRPLSNSFVNWRTGQVNTSAPFLPDGGAGVYQFRARMRRFSNGAASGWSPVAVADTTADRTPPQLNVGPKPAFVVGTIVDPVQMVEAPNFFAENIAQRITWSASDDVGVCSYDLYRVWAGGPPVPVFVNSSQTEYVDLATDYDGTFGGGSSRTQGFLVTARDCSGNTTTKSVAQRVEVTQENGQSATALPGSSTVTYTGQWATSSCTCFLWGATRRSSASGARVTFSHTFAQGDHMAVVMAKGPGRGRAAIRVDGVVVATIDTFASVNTNRVVVFERMMSAGTHTVSITNLATVGRPRIDLDAVMTN